MKTVIQELIDIMNKDQVGFTEWFLDNYNTYLEKENEQILNAYNQGAKEVQDVLMKIAKEQIDKL